MQDFCSFCPIYHAFIEYFIDDSLMFLKFEKKIWAKFTYEG